MPVWRYAEGRLSIYILLCTRHFYSRLSKSEYFGVGNKPPWEVKHSVDKEMHQLCWIQTSATKGRHYTDSGVIHDCRMPQQASRCFNYCVLKPIVLLNDYNPRSPDCQTAGARGSYQLHYVKLTLQFSTAVDYVALLLVSVQFWRSAKPFFYGFGFMS